jgi:hypothetical protein
MSLRVLLGVLVISIATTTSYACTTEQQLSALRFSVIDLPPYGCKNENRQPVCYHNESLKQKIRDITQTIPEELKQAWLKTAKEHALQH